MKANVIKVLQERGFIEAMTSQDLVELAFSPIRCYIGFDPTAESLHLGNLVGVVALVWFQRLGHIPYILIGGATGKIGDPSGKSVERPLLSEERLAFHVDSIKTQLSKFLDFSACKNPAVILNNDDWLSKMSMTEFLRSVGKHFRIGSMLGKESVRARIQSEEGMSYTEFSYSLLQAYDFYYLNLHYGVTLQFGGSDQWGNITAGIEFTRKVSQTTLYGATFPLLTRSDGKKFGKSEEGAVWLSSDLYSPYKMYQYLYGISDEDVIKLLRMLTFIDMAEILEIEKSLKSQSLPPNTAQKRLAEEVTRFVHGEEGLQTAIRVTQAAQPGARAILDSTVLQEIKADMPSIDLPSKDVMDRKFVEVLALSKMCASKGEGARLIKNGGAYLNNRKIEDPERIIQKSDLIDGRFLLLSIGKKTRLLIQVF